MSITALPTPPSRGDTPANFITKSDAFIAALPQFVTEANAQAVLLTLASTTDTSATSNVIGTGAKTFTVTAGKSFVAGMYLVIADTSAPSTNSMFGQITSYIGTSLVMNILGITGSGTKTAWTISQSSAGGAALGNNSDITSVLPSVSAFKLIASATASASASLDFTGLSGYKAIMFVIDHLVPTNAADYLGARVSTDNGTTYVATANYYYAQLDINSAGTTVAGGGSTADRCVLTGATTGAGSGGGCSGNFTCFDLDNATMIKHFNADITRYNGTNFLRSVVGTGQAAVTTAFNAIRFLFSTGTIASGSIYCYGIR